MVNSVFVEIQDLLDEDPHLFYSLDNDGLTLGPPSASDLFRVEPGETGELVLNWGTWHGHYEQPSDCLDTIRRIISGNIRRMLQYKHNILAASWIEQMHEDGCSRANISIFLNPFDEDAWIGAEDANWEVIVGYAFLGEVPGVLVFPNAKAHGFGIWEERPTYQPFVPDEWMLRFLAKTLGEPPSGWTWTSVEGNSIAFLKPKSWDVRVEESDYAGLRVSQFVSPDRSAWIWVQCFWSELDEQHDFEPGAIIIPTTLTAHALQAHESIHRSMVDVEFEGPYERMLVRFTCDSTNASHYLHKVFHDSCKSTRRLVPNG